MSKTIKLSSVITRPIVTFDGNRRPLESSAGKQNISKFNKYEVSVIANNREEIIENIITILSETKTRLMFDSGVFDEYIERFGQKLPPDWVQIAKQSNRIDVEVHNYSNTTKTMISIPVKRRMSSEKSFVESKPVSGDKQSIPPLIESRSEPQIQPKAVELLKSKTLFKQAFDYIMTTPGYECEVCITHCTNSGDIYVQIEGEYYETFNVLMDRMNELLISEKASIPSIDVLKEEMNKSEKRYYFVNFDNDWCRCLVENVMENESIKVFYVDFGNEQVINRSQMRSLEPNSDPLIIIPYLAVKCVLNVNIEWSDAVADLFFTLFTLNDIMKMRIVSPKTDSCVASVEIIDKNSVLNDKLMAAYEKLINTKPNNTLNETIVQNEKQVVESMISALSNAEAGGDDVIFGGKPIPKPILPSVKPNPKNAEDFFDLLVLLAATPNHFIVIPFDNINSNSKFNQMKQRMHDLYEKEENRIELPENVITKGLFIAGKYKHMWYRIQVKEIINRNPFQVMCLLVDYGEIQSFDLRDIQPLYNEFRELPIQAIKASLATAEPKTNDWDVFACIEFRKMVENKPFVATVFDIKQVDDEPVLSVSLCDTSGANDVYIGKSLVEKGLANIIVRV